MCQDDDGIDESDVYIDLGEDTEEELQAALNSLVQQAQENGLSSQGLSTLRQILLKHRKVFRVRLGRSDPARVTPIEVNVDSKCQLVHVKLRRYSEDRRKFLEKYIYTLQNMGM